jgi:hypothetical protein
MRKTTQRRACKHGQPRAKGVPKSQNGVFGGRCLRRCPKDQAMKAFARSIAIAASLLGILALAPEAAVAANHGGSGGGHSGGSWSGHSGGAWHGGGWHGHGYWGHGGYWPYWGWGVGVGLGIGYWGAYPYYGGYYAAYPYYGGYFDAPPVMDPTYSTVEPATGTHPGQPVPQAGHAPDPIYYPKNGQSAATSESDRRECNRWATTQAGAMNDASIFQRATFACMEGRGYTVR